MSSLFKKLLWLIALAIVIAERKKGKREPLSPLIPSRII